MSVKREDSVNLIVAIIGSFENHQCSYVDLEVLYRRLCGKINRVYDNEAFYDSMQQLCYGRGIKYALDRQNTITLLAIGSAEAIILRHIRPDFCKIIDELVERLRVVKSAINLLVNKDIDRR